MGKNINTTLMSADELSPISTVTSPYMSSNNSVNSPYMINSGNPVWAPSFYTNTYTSSDNFKVPGEAKEKIKKEKLFEVIDLSLKDTKNFTIVDIAESVNLFNFSFNSKIIFGLSADPNAWVSPVTFGVLFYGSDKIISADPGWFDFIGDSDYILSEVNKAIEEIAQCMFLNFQYYFSQSLNRLNNYSQNAKTVL